MMQSFAYFIYSVMSRLQKALCFIINKKFLLILIVFRFIQNRVAVAADSVDTHRHTQTSLSPDTSSSSSGKSPRRFHASQETQGMSQYRGWILQRTRSTWAGSFVHS
ncbi:hypothetical protein XENORESO_000990 [Xenotaenia resolanae]|uniref:Secreted protein n=1 Tax=Xenotaenia resolanae TaxID=208358 RepID=A0ABV0VN64_9TELE